VTCAASRGSSGGLKNERRKLLFPRLTGQRAAAGRFDSGPAHISANLELIIQEIGNGANDWRRGKTCDGPERRAFYGGEKDA